MKLIRIIYIINLLFFLLLNFNTLPIKSNNYLFEKFPGLQNKIPHICLCDLPTPISKLEKFQKYLKCKNIFIKKDNLTGKKLDNSFRLYGGNKPRKLEFILADALNKNAKTIITFGCAGSNHAVATSVYSNYLRLKCILMLIDQPNSIVVRQNLLLNNIFQSKLIYFSDALKRDFAAKKILENKDFYLIPIGGSTEIGALGFVNAGLELESQIKQNLIKEPDYIYVANGSCATTAGLLLGLRVANIKSKIVAVCVEPEKEENEFLLKIENLYYKTNKYLNSLDSKFSIFEFPRENLILNKKFCGIEYGLFITEVVDAMKLFEATENIKLECTYSAKATAAIINDSNILQDKIVLFWNTYCNFEPLNLISFEEYKKLPKEFHKYFENDIQY